MTIFSTRNKWTMVGWTVGVILAVVNLGFLGFLGTPFFVLFEGIVRIFGQRMPCSGEGCWGILILVGSLGYLLTPPLLFSLIRRIKHKKVFFICVFVLLALALLLIPSL